MLYPQNGDRIAAIDCDVTSPMYRMKLVLERPWCSGLFTAHDLNRIELT